MTTDNHTSDTPLKRCSKGDNCLHPNGPLLPATTEYFYKRTGDGLKAHCKDCEKARVKLWSESNPDKVQKRSANYYQRNKERLQVVHHEYYLEHHEEILANHRKWKQAHPDFQREYHKKWSIVNRHLTREYGRRYRQRNAEKTRLRKQWYAQQNQNKYRVYNHTRRARERNAEGSHTDDDIRLLYASQGGKCWYCLQPVSDKYHVEHRVPLSRGGSNDARNLVISCASCNLSKGAKLPHEWGGRLL